ncbi:MAG: DNA-packaging protein [Oscillospiraceae bacterium]|nr:DNA-packaging protein [Oscillospiraceae bacterium]
MLEKVRLALRVTTNAFDSEIASLIDAALKDLEAVGVKVSGADGDALLVRAVVTYCKLYFSEPDRVDFWDRLKASYDELKAQLSMSTEYRRGDVTPG